MKKVKLKYLGTENLAQWLIDSLNKSFPARRTEAYLLLDRNPTRVVFIIYDRSGVPKDQFSFDVEHDTALKDFYDTHERYASDPPDASDFVHKKSAVKKKAPTKKQVKASKKRALKK